MQFTPSSFNRLLGPKSGVGQKVSWRCASQCPCRSYDSGQPRVDCPICRGRGTFWGRPVAAWTALAGMKIAREWAAFGMWQSGDVVLSIGSDSPLYALQEFDRVRMSQSSEPFHSVLTRGDGDVLGEGVLSIARCFWLNPAGTAVIEGGIPTVSPCGIMTWRQGRLAPPAGVQYSLNGRRMPEYFAFKEFPQDRAHSSGMPLPRRVVLRRFDLFGKATV